jgi:hypothetical protein
MNRISRWMPLWGICIVAAGGALCVQPSLGATLQPLPNVGVTGTKVVLITDNSVFPSQRPRYLSGSNGTPESRFTHSPDAGSNPWGLSPITPTEGIVMLRPGETDRTAGEQDLGARAAGATHGHAPVVRPE